MEVRNTKLSVSRSRVQKLQSVGQKVVPFRTLDKRQEPLCENPKITNCPNINKVISCMIIQPNYRKHSEGFCQPKQVSKVEKSSKSHLRKGLFAFSKIIDLMTPILASATLGTQKFSISHQGNLNTPMNYYRNKMLDQKAGIQNKGRWKNLNQNPKQERLNNDIKMHLTCQGFQGKVSHNFVE